MSGFSKLLVANRGEIAVRVLRSARALGYATVAVYSEADADAPHVKLADEAVCLGPAPVAESYLDPQRLLQAAKSTGADAVHPGYGFLSENADFAQACVDAGLVFVGPPASAIALMGDKVRAKRRMIDAGVPTAPGYTGEDTSTATLLAKATQLGVPLLVKAVAGGGGRGMRKVTEPDQLASAIASAQSEAASAFGNGEVFLERLVTGARHVEIQVFADTLGNVVHLGERECSAQRRHQKVVEEAPSVAVDARLRETMGQAAVAATRAIEYVGAGTVEFLLDDDGSFYFLEMNTRLQVEHPVTELVTGFDLVGWQLDIAAGKPLPVTQDEVRWQGHAIEVRLYAEDPYSGFLPQTGTIVRFDPADRAGVRVDSGIASGGEISSFYDPMLAKLIGYGRDREEARRRLLAGLRDTVFMGPVCNLEFLISLLEDREFIDGAIKTDTLDARFAEPPPRPGCGVQMWAVAALAHAHDHRLGAGGPELADATAWRSSGALASHFTLRSGDEERVCTVGLDEGASAVVTVGDTTVQLHRIAASPGQLRVEIDGVSRPFAVERRGRVTHVGASGLSRAFVEPDAVAEAAVRSDGVVRAPLAGVVLQVPVELGQRVEAGQLLVTVEAMKMEHRIEAPMPGTVAELTVSPGAQVTGGQQLSKIEPDSEPSS